MSTPRIAIATAVKIRNDGPSPSRLSPVPEVEVGRDRRQGGDVDQQRGPTLEPDRVQGEPREQRHEDRDRQQDGRGDDREQSRGRASARPAASRTRRWTRRARRRDGRRGSGAAVGSTSASASVGSVATGGAGRGPVRTPSLLPAHGPSSVFGVRVGASSVGLALGGHTEAPLRPQPRDERDDGNR